MSDELVQVSQEAIEKAWENWIEFHYGIDCEEVMERFCKCVDYGDLSPEPIDPWTCEDDTIKTHHDIAARVNLLAGPHYHTAIKTYYAKHPWK